MHLLLCALFLLLGCASAPPPPTRPPLTRLEYRVELPHVPTAAHDLALSLRLPPDESAHPLEAFLLVGNASLSLSLEQGSGEVRREFADLAWDAEQRLLLARSRGRPLELGLRLGTAAGAPRGELERVLAQGTSAEVDGRPLEGVRARLLDRP